MTECKWTPGPWTWENESGEWPDDALIGRDGDAVLWWDFDIGFSFGHPNNTHLIAAAPDLYDTMENLIIAIGMGWDLDGVIDADRAALAKARGE